MCDYHRQVLWHRWSAFTKCLPGDEGWRPDAGPVDMYPPTRASAVCWNRNITKPHHVLNFFNGGSCNQSTFDAEMVFWLERANHLEWPIGAVPLGGRWMEVVLCSCYNQISKKASLHSWVSWICLIASGTIASDNVVPNRPSCIHDSPYSKGKEALGLGGCNSSASKEDKTWSRPYLGPAALPNIGILYPFGLTFTPKLLSMLQTI